MNNQDALEKLNHEIIHCRKCPRLVAWREQVAEEKKRAYLAWEYWGKPVPGFGDINGRIMVIGLAPGAHGSNRTGRMFTGDASGDFLFPALFRADFANQPESTSINDGLTINDLFITAACRCAPPDNKPTKDEIDNCRGFLMQESALMLNLQGIVALGRIGFEQALNLLRYCYDYEINPKPRFSHSAVFFSEELPNPWLISSYHPSRQNTQTGRLTSGMFDEIWVKARNLLR